MNLQESIARALIKHRVGFLAASANDATIAQANEDARIALDAISKYPIEEVRLTDAQCNRLRSDPCSLNETLRMAHDMGWAAGRAHLTPPEARQWREGCSAPTVNDQ